MTGYKTFNTRERKTRLIFTCSYISLSTLFRTSLCTSHIYPNQTQLSGISKQKKSKFNFITIQGWVSPTANPAKKKKRKEKLSRQTTCSNATSDNWRAWVISTIPSSPTGVGAVMPPMIFGDMKAITCSSSCKRLSSREKGLDGWMRMREREREGEKDEHLLDYARGNGWGGEHAATFP